MAQSSTAILWPTIMLVVFILSVWFHLLRRRFGHIAAHPPSARDFAHAEAVARYFRPVERPAHNLANLFEMPVLYFALVPLMMITGRASLVQVALAWAFVGLRAWHSFLHIGLNPIRLRARVYIASCTMLAAMWLGFAIDLIIAGTSA
jgi:hypothetical protein